MPVSMSGFGDAFKSTEDYLINMSIQKPDLTIVVSGTSVYLDVEAVDGGDIDFWFLDSDDLVKYTLDCTTGSGAGGKARIELPQGTSDVPVKSYVYVAYDEQASALVMFTSITPPTGAFCNLAIVAIQDYATVTATGPLAYQRTTEAVQHDDKGAVSWMREKLRGMGAVYLRGVDPDLVITTNAGSEDDIDLNLTAGTVFQLHRQAWPAYDVSTDGLWVANADGSGTLDPYEKITNLNQIHEISSGVAISDGDSLNLVIWGAINYSTGDCKLFVNLPTNKYTTDADAVIDKDKTAVLTIPPHFKFVGFRICQLVLKYNSADNGTWSNLLTGSTLVWSNQAEDESSPSYPSNYPNNSDVTVTLTKAGAVSVKVHFDDFNTEASYDLVRLLDGADAVQYTYSGNLGEFTSDIITGDTVKVRFTSDSSVRRKGFHIDALEYSTTVASGSEFIDLRLGD